MGRDQLAARGIEHGRPAAAARPATAAGWRAAQHGADARHQHPRVERLAQIIIRPGLESGDDILRRLARREQQDRHDGAGRRAGRRSAPARFRRASSRPAPSGRNPWRAAFRAPRRRCRLGDAETMLRQKVAQQLAEAGIVIDQQNMRRVLLSAVALCQSAAGLRRHSAASSGTREVFCFFFKRRFLAIIRFAALQRDAHPAIQNPDPAAWSSPATRAGTPPPPGRQPRGTRRQPFALHLEQLALQRRAFSVSVSSRCRRSLGPGTCAT